MKKGILTFLRIKLLLFFGLSIWLSSNTATAGTTYLKESATKIEYDTSIEGGFGVLGVKVPFGFSISGGSTAIGVTTYCDWAFATCDNSKNGFKAF